jgi:hypothetical protein
VTSKKLNALFRSVPHATAIDAPVAAPATEIEAQASSPAVSPALAVSPTAELAGQGRAPVPARPKSARPATTDTTTAASPAAASEREVPLQVLIPTSVRRQLAEHCTKESVSLRAAMLQAIRSLGIEVSDEEINGKRGRKNY